MSTRLATACLGAATLFLSACATTSTTTPSGGGSAEPQPAAPRYNLSGYSASFKQGYSDACATPRRRDGTRIQSDNDYSMGWNDGSSACRNR